MDNIKEMTDKISALKAFKDQINAAIRDEQEAQRMYDKMAGQADKAGARTYSSEIRGIREQEHTHENKFRDMLRSTDTSILEYERKVKEEEHQRRLVEQQRKEQEYCRTRTGRR